MSFFPEIGDYDNALGIDAQLINYIRESLEIASRISPRRAYLLQQNISGSQVGSAGNPITIPSGSFYFDGTYYRAAVWIEGQPNFPDIRPYISDNTGTFTVLIDNAPATRVLLPQDLVNNNEFALVDRVDLVTRQIELVLNAGFAPAGHNIQYYYSTVSEGVTQEIFKRGQSKDQSLYGWTQYLNNTSDQYRGPHQILVRVPVSSRGFAITEDGKQLLESIKSWMIWTPFVRVYDVLVFPPDQAPHVSNYYDREERYEIINKEDSIIQGVLVSQRFGLRFLEFDDYRYNIPYRTS